MTKLSRRSASGLIASVLAGPLAGVSAGEAAAKRPGVGDPAPGSVGFDLEGNPVTLDAYAGKVIVLSFWATWCTYCRQELPQLKGAQDLAGGKLQVLAINIEERVAFRRAAHALAPLGLTVVHDGDRRARDAYGVGGIPHLVIIGRDGRIAAVHVGYGESSLGGIIDEMNHALSAPASPA